VGLLVGSKNLRFHFNLKGRLTFIGKANSQKLFKPARRDFKNACESKGVPSLDPFRWGS